MAILINVLYFVLGIICFFLGLFCCAAGGFCLEWANFLKAERGKQKVFTFFVVGAVLTGEVGGTLERMIQTFFGDRPHSTTFAQVLLVVCVVLCAGIGMWLRRRLNDRPGKTAT